jgi:hypothetical protein
MADNANPPRAGDAAEEVTQMLELAAAPEGKDYDLPFGEPLTSSGAGADLLEIATARALEGDISVFASGGDAGTLAAWTGSEPNAEAAHNSGFDAARAQQILQEVTQSDHRRAERTAETAQDALGQGQQSKPAASSGERASCYDRCMRFRTKYSYNPFASHCNIAPYTPRIGNLTVSMSILIFQSLPNEIGFLISLRLVKSIGSIGWSESMLLSLS